MADEESRIIDLLERKSKCIKSLDDKWILEWSALIEKYFKFEKRNHIRLKAIALLSQIFSKYHIIYEDELMNKIILPNFQDYIDDHSQQLQPSSTTSIDDSVIRKPIVHLLFDIANCCLSYKHCNAILAIIRKILNKPFNKIHPQQQQLLNNEQLASSTTTTNTTNNCDHLPTSTVSTIPNDMVYVIGNIDIIDSRLIISNINKLFKVKLFKLPIDPAVNMLDIAVNYLNLTYKCPLQDPMPAEIPMIRRELFSLFLNLRCNKHGHLGVLDSKTNCISSQSQHQNNNNNSQATQKDDLKHSPFIICVKRPRHLNMDKQPPSPQASMLDSPTQPNSGSQQHFQLNFPFNSNTHQQAHNSNHSLFNQNIFVPNAAYPNCPIVSRCVNLDAMFAGIIACITHETDLDVLKLVLDGLPGLLANKPLVLTAAEERINKLCISLSHLTTSSKACHQRQNFITKCGLRCLTTLLVYRKLLDQKSIKTMLAAFEDSLKISHPFPIVPLFTTCLIELQDSSEMTRFLPVVLTRLSKFSPTINLGISMLEFLSYLILFPKLYENFSEDEYKYVFAIALPYTNPFRFSDYITCLAFRVLAMWYLNCRPALRCAFVELVKKSLQNNVIQPFKESHLSTNATIYSLNNQNNHQLIQTSPNPILQTPPITYSAPASMSPVDQRKRSSSLNTENSFKHQQAALGLTNQQLSLQVNEELIETFADLLSRYTHGQCIAVAPKNKCIEQLVDRTTSQTWLHGNSLVTITSSRSSHGWAEIMIRRPTGNTSWVGRLQNTLGAVPMCMSQQVYLDSLNFGNDVISLFSAMTFSENCANNSDESSATDSKSQSTSASLTNTPSSSLLNPSSFILTSTGNSIISGGVSNISSANSGNASAAALTTASASTLTLNSNSYQHLHTNQQQRLRDPIPLPKDKKFDITLSNFDHITPYETHKIGVVYVGKNQADNRVAILSNRRGSQRYYEFLKNIGNCIILNEIDPEVYFIGGLDAKGDDGKFAYLWKDNLTQVIFHVTTFMPARESDPQCNNKNRHIGNDHVCIVYNDSGQQFHMSTIKGTGQFITACIVITPLEDMSNIVDVEVLPDLRQIVGDIEPKVLSNLGASLYARQLAIHLNVSIIKSNYIQVP